jgi:hypothetical protein
MEVHLIDAHYVYLATATCCVTPRPRESHHDRRPGRLRERLLRIAVRNQFHSWRVKKIVPKKCDVYVNYGPRHEHLL